jgi:hypothetical protein
MNGKRILTLTILSLSLAGVLVACGDGGNQAAQNVEAFLQALVDKDEAQMVSYTCGDFEMDALLEYDAFALVKTQVDNLSCQVDQVDGDAALVSCQGKIIATYGNEDREFDLSERTYQVINSGGEWLVCGY